MPLFYVTGVSGSGKSAVLRELQARGLEAHGVDEHGFGVWFRRETGRAVQFPESPDNTPEWRDAHRWTLDVEKIRELRKQSDEAGRAVFLCGVAEGDALVWDAFGKVFALVVDADTVEQRIHERTDNEFGKTPSELERVLEWQKSFEENYRRFGAVIVDATRPVKNVVDEILSVSSSEVFPANRRGRVRGAR